LGISLGGQPVKHRHNEPYLFYALFKFFFCLLYLFLIVLICLLACMLGPDACVTLEGARSKSFKDLEFQEQELKTLSSYSLKERQVFP
jgi:hypothetical protein